MEGSHYPVPRAEAIEFVRNTKERAVLPQILDFVARVQPRSALLRELCLNSVFPAFNLTENDPGKAIELLARDFSGDSVTRDAIHAKLQGGQFVMHGHRAIWALCEFAPETKCLEEEMTQFRIYNCVSGEWRIQGPADMALICAKAENEEVLSVIHFLLRGCRPNLRYFAGGFHRPIMRRVGKDRDLQELLWKELQSTSNPSERGSFLSLLVSAQGLTPALREWCRAECDRSSATIPSAVGIDIVTGLVRPLREFSAAALFENPRS